MTGLRAGVSRFEKTTAEVIYATAEIIYATADAFFANIGAFGITIGVMNTIFGNTLNRTAQGGCPVLK